MAGRVLTPQEVYAHVLTFDDHVRFKRLHTAGSYRPSKPMGGQVARLPREYTRWADNAAPEEIDEFWNAITKFDFDEAQRLSGLSGRVIADLIAQAQEGQVRLSGRAAPEEAYWLGIPLQRVLNLTRLDGNMHKYFHRYANKGSGPPYAALGKRAHEAFEKFTRLLNKEKGSA